MSRFSHKQLSIMPPVDQQTARLAVVCGLALSVALGWNLIINQVLPVGILRQLGTAAPGEAQIGLGLLLMWLGSLLYLRYADARRWLQSALASFCVLSVVVPLVIVNVWPLVNIAIQSLFGDVQFDPLQFLSALLCFVVVLALKLLSGPRAWRRVALAGGSGMVLLVLGEVASMPFATGSSTIAGRFWVYVPLLWVLVTFVVEPQPRRRGGILVG